MLDTWLAAMQSQSALIVYNVSDASLLTKLPSRVAGQELPGARIRWARGSHLPSMKGGR